MPTAMRHFLSRSPAPVALRAVRPDGTAVTIAIQATRRRWSDAEAALPPDATRVEAMDAEGRVLRVHALDSDEEDVPAGAARSSSPQVGVPVTPIDLARIVLEATDAGAKRHAAAYEATQRELVGLVRVIADQHHAAQRRLAALESAWHKAITRAAPAEEDDGAAGVEAMLAPVIAAAFGGGAPTPPRKEKAG